MSFPQLMNNDCCLLTNIDLNPQRINYLFDRRFKSNSIVTSFHFKSFHPEQPSNNAKVSRSLLRFQPKLISTDDSEDNTASDSYPSEEEEVEEEEEHEEGLLTNDDEYLNALAEWEPESFLPILESDDEEDDDGDYDGKDVNESIFQSITDDCDNDKNDETIQMNCPIADDEVANSTEDLLVTFIHRPIKDEPRTDHDNNISEYLPQLDGQADVLTTEPSTESVQTSNNKDLSSVIAKIKANRSLPHRTIQIYKVPAVLNQSRSNDDAKKKPVSPITKKPTLNSAKVDRIKETPNKLSKPISKTKTKLLSSLLKSNEDAIRESDTRFPSKKNPIQATLPDTNGHSKLSKHTNQSKKSISALNGKHIAHQKRKKLSSNDKQKYILETPQSKEKPASVHLALAEQKLQQYQQLQKQKEPVSNTFKSNGASPSLTKIKPSTKTLLKSSKSLDITPKKSDKKLKTTPQNNHSQQIKKKSKSLKRLNIHETKIPPNNELQQPKAKKRKSDEHHGLEDGQSSSIITTQLSEPVISTTESNESIKKRPENFFDGCIIIDDDDNEQDQLNQRIDSVEEDDNDIQEIEQQKYSISYDIRTREKLIDHAVHSSLMHLKWLFNLEYVLLEHIYICHEKEIRPSNKVYENSVITKSEYQIHSSSYSINPSFISTVMINFIKMFILRNSVSDQQEFLFLQFGITSHLRYLLVELPTQNHIDINDSDGNCYECHQYLLNINILFDLLFDLIEYDLCENVSRTKYRSSLIEDDYFTRFSQSNVTKTQPYDRIKLIIYFIELTGIHMNKCQNKKQFQFNQSETKLFDSIEDVIRNIVSQKNNSSIYEKISICFSIMELCLLFVKEKDNLIKKMALFLADLCQDDSNLFNLFLFDVYLLVDIRLLLINELISRRFNLKLLSINHIIDLFRRVHEILNFTDPIDESVLSLVRSLFSSYADLISEVKQIPCMYSSSAQQLTTIFNKQLVLIFSRLKEITSNNQNCLEKIKRTLILYRLLISRWQQI